MTRRVALYSALLCVLLPAAGSAQQSSPSPMEPHVVTSGEGLVTAVPDRAWISVSAESRASNPKEAQQRNAALMTPVIEKLKAARVPAEAIRTTGYDLQQEFDFVNNRRVSRGYVARNSIEVRIDAVDRVGELLEIAVGSGATSVGGVRFDLKDRAKFEREALRLAVADARARADAAAAGAGRTVAVILRIDAAGGSNVPIPMPRMMSMKEASQADAPPVSIGQMEIRAQVTLTASLK